MRYVALLRGINVGGKNIIPMPRLKACFEELGLADVSTYIASGNVLFRAAGSARALTGRIERALATAFRYRASIVLRSAAEMRTVVTRAPRGFGTDPASYRYDVAFLKEPLTARVAVKQVPQREGVDQAYAGRGVVYFSRLVKRVTQSKLNRLTQLPIYQQMTLRNWNTTTKLLDLLTGGAAA